MTYTYDWPMQSVTCDVILYDPDLNKVLLIERGIEPDKGKLAFPGGHIGDDDLEQAAIRELEEETGIKINSLEQFYTYGNPGRDPRGRYVTIVWYKFVDSTQYKPVAGDDAKRAVWVKAEKGSSMGLDHGQILTEFLNTVGNWGV